MVVANTRHGSLSRAALKQQLISKFAKSNRLVARQRSWPKQLWKMEFWLETRRLKTKNTIHKHCMLVGKDDSHMVLGYKFWNGFSCRVKLISKCMVNGGRQVSHLLQTKVINTKEGGGKSKSCGTGLESKHQYELILSLLYINNYRHVSTSWYAYMYFLAVSTERS